jgi:hypothetical protein
MIKILIGKHVDNLTREITYFVYDNEGYVYRRGFKYREDAKAAADYIRKQA